jgi:DNA-binding XRE family transcriptional regulator
MFDAAGDLLYVGLSVNYGQRFSNHSKAKPWWLEVVRIDVEHFDSVRAAKTAERTAIATENPRFNFMWAADPDASPIRRIRMEAGMTREELAASAGMSSRSIENYENGHMEPGTGAAIKLADVLGVTLDELVGRTPPEPLSP